MFSHTGPLLVLCAVLTSALCCDWLTEYSDLRNSSVTLVELMGGAFTDQESPSPVPFPYKLYAQVEKKGVQSQLLFIRDSLQQIYLLFSSSSLSSTGWDAVKTTQFLESLHRQVEELSSCVSLHQQTNSRLKKYYRRLKNSTGGSAASWELLRRETKDHLDRLDLLGNLVKESAASRGRSTDSSPL
ncbi:interferon a3-like [Odontesthes bonariensis]|uniref:interferon a3-like n=1 Tax=Odontesthes bonariensis TaxID=219752 RepID=UPI003F58D5DC